MLSSGHRPARALLWFRDDLRLSDNPALNAALESAEMVTALYVFDDESAGSRRLGGASRWWLSRSLKALARDCAAARIPFAVRRGSAAAVVREAAREAAADLVVWNRRYDPGAAEIDALVESDLRTDGREVRSFNGRLLYEPWDVASKSGAPLKVYSPFWRACRARGEPRAPLRRLTAASVRSGPTLDGVSVDDLRLEPKRPDWAGGLRKTWVPGEAGAAETLGRFLDEGLRGYAANRDRPDRPATSRMSPHLRFGEISPNQLWHAAAAASADGAASASDVEKFHSELGWREFSYHLLHHNPDLASRNFQSRFDAFPWRTLGPERTAWRRGLTGYPIVDAGMRQLWTTGWMHNRVRMICASFLIKDLLVDWRDGEAWFWDTLVDADPANNAASWQWVAGSGADAAPYFRVFNPTLQGEKFDPDGAYVRRFVPELAQMPARWIHRPWEAPQETLSKAGVQLGQDYPAPIVDHDAARARALGAFERIKAQSASAPTPSPSE